MVQFRASAAERAWQVRGRFARGVVAFLLMSLTALAWALVAPTPAYAADDQIDSFDIDYDVQPSGVVKVKETITYRFGDNSGRHGIERLLVTREPYDATRIRLPDHQHQRDEPDTSRPSSVREPTRRRVAARSSSGCVSATQTRPSPHPPRLMSSPTTWPVPCAPRAAMTSSTGMPPAWIGRPSIKEVTISIAVPGGVQDTTCTYGQVNSTEQCAAKIADGKAQYTRSNLAPGEGVRSAPRSKRA